MTIQAFVDTHVHLDADAFDPDRQDVIQRAFAAGATDLVIPATHAKSWFNIKQICSKSQQLHPAFGLHPTFLKHHAPTDVHTLSSWLETPGTVAVGEIGLDFHDPDLDPDTQREYFVQQLKLAREKDLPVIVHARDAVEEVTLTMRRHGGLRGVVHSFSGSQQQAENLWKIGFHLGIGGPVTYDRARRLRRIVADMPLEYLLLESDAPDQPDADHRGQRNEPARVANVLHCIAALRNESVTHVAEATSANARRLFGFDRLPGID